MRSKCLLIALFVTALTLGGCGGDGGTDLSCGEGTHEASGLCVPDSELECGPGTVEQNGECVPEHPLTCGEGTMELDGECIPDGPDCGLGAVPRGDECVGADLQYINLPFPAGMTVEVSQGYLGLFSHYDDDRYAVDFPCPEGTSIVAARGGVVVDMEEDNTIGCPDASCLPYSNYVTIDHGDGTTCFYGHLQHQGALVDVGDVVCTGTPIGLSGNTGRSSGPHLHFEVRDQFRYTLPLYVEEIGELNEGVLFEGPLFVSANVEPAVCTEPHTWSDCPADTFVHRGVLLDPGVPCTAADLDQGYTVSGTASWDTVVILRKHLSLDEWRETCVPVGTDGRFQANLSWTTAGFSGEERSYLMITAGSTNCGGYDGWKSSVRIYLQP